MQTRKPQRKLDREELWDYALRSLGQRAQTVSEIRQKLSRRAATLDDIPATLERLREYNMLNDQRFSESFAASRLQNQGFGRFRVLRDLKGKRVSDQVATQAIEQAYSGTNEPELIDAYLVRKYRGKNLREFLAEEKNLAGAYRRLRTAGFGSSAIFSSLKKYSTALEEFTEPEEEV